MQCSNRPKRNWEGVSVERNPLLPATSGFTAGWLGLGSWFRAHSKGGVAAHIFAIGYFLMTSVVFEI